MPEYRIFTIGSDGHFVGVPKIAEFADDEEVGAADGEWCGCRDLES